MMPMARWMALGALLVTLTGAGTARAEDCTDPWVVVVKKDNTTVEGRLIKDTEQGVLLEVEGRSTFVPEPDIREVVEDCSRKAAPPEVARRAPAPRSRVAATESRFRNSFIDATQRGLRWVGGGCLGLGCSLFGTGIVVVVLGLAGAVAGTSGADPLTAVTAAGIVMVIVSGVAGLIGGSGAAMLLAAQLADFLRVDPSAAPPPDPLSGADF